MKWKILWMLAAAGISLSVAQAQPADSTSPTITVEAASIGTGIQDRQPVGVDTTFSGDVGMVYCWTKITGAQDSTAVTFVWSRNGEEVARVDLPVKSPNWRTWSSKIIKPEWTGSWDVRVLDSNGALLKSLSFKVTPASVAPATPAAAPVDTAAVDTAGATNK